MNEITVTASLSFSKSGRTASLAKAGLQVDMTGTDYVKFTQQIGTSEEAINIPSDIGTPGWVMFKNLSADYEIRIRAATGAADLVSMLAGESAGPFRLKATAPFAVAITGAAQLEVLLMEA